MYKDIENMAITLRKMILRLYTVRSGNNLYMWQDIEVILQKYHRQLLNIWHNNEKGWRKKSGF